jgi:cysteine synthase A
MNKTEKRRWPELGGADVVHDGVLSTIGATPIVRLLRYFPDADFELFGKLESLNPGGSIKDRPAKEILEAGLSAGEVGPGTVVVESSSGNMGIGLAQACRYYGLRLICVVDPKTTNQNLRVLKAYGAQIDYVAEPDPVSGEFLQARIRRVQELLRTVDGSFWPNQYANRHNPHAHYRTTIEEVVRALDGRVDFVFAAVSTCGTIRGCAEYVRDQKLSTRIVAVDAQGSVIFGDRKADRCIPGLGAGIQPPLCDLSLIHNFVHVSDRDCVAGCRRLVQREAILAGGSSGGVLAGVEKWRDRIPPGARCVAILCDRGERYLDTVYDDEWVRDHLGPIHDDWAVTSEPVPTTSEYSLIESTG